MPEKVREDMERCGYEWSGLPIWESDDIIYDPYPTFRKNIATDDGKITYGAFKVDGEYHPEIQEFSFRIYATLYPNVHARIADQQGGLYYQVDFMDKQLYTTMDELPTMLELYERKFTTLITALRMADPEDGLPW